MIEPLWSTATRPKPALAHFDEAEAQKAVEFFGLLTHTQGEFAGQPFDLLPEQEWLVREMFGWKLGECTGKEGESCECPRLYRTVYIEMGRGNGKSEFGAGIAGKLLFADHEASAEVIGAAATRQQARDVCMARLKGMINASPLLRKRALTLRGEIRVPATNSVYRAVSSDVGGNWGAVPSGVIFDEVHAQPNRELWDAIVTATGKRSQPLVVALTTAGWNRESLCWELHEYTRQIAKGEVDDSRFLGVIWAAKETDDWTDPAVWRRANPSLGVIVSEEFLASECEKAKATPAFQNTFRTMYLSQWVGQEVRFFPMERWPTGDRRIIVVQAKMIVHGGLDLSSTTDLTALAFVRDEDDWVGADVKFYAPQEGVRDRALRDRVPYEAWAAQGLLTLTPGRVVNYDYVFKDIAEARGLCNLKDVGYDRWNSSDLVRRLEEQFGEEFMVKVGQGYGDMSAPTKELLRLVADGRFAHGGNPILRWMAENAAGLIDAAGNVKLDKSKSTARIDGMVAICIALDGLMRRGRLEKRKSVYSKRGLVTA